MFSRGIKTSRALGRYTGKEAVLNLFEPLKKQYEKKPKKLREEELVLVQLVYLIQLVKASGFEGFYRSDKGDDAIDLSHHFSRIDLEPGYQMMYESMQVFSGMISKDRLIRNTYIDDNLEKCQAVWIGLDQRFADLELTIYDHIVEYVRDNILDFR